MQDQIFEALKKATAPLSALDVSELIGKGCSPSAVRGELRELAERGAVRQVNVPGMSTRYELADKAATSLPATRPSKAAAAPAEPLPKAKLKPVQKPAPAAAKPQAPQPVRSSRSAADLLLLANAQETKCRPHRRGMSPADITPYFECYHALVLKGWVAKEILPWLREQGVPSVSSLHKAYPKWAKAQAKA